MTYLTAAELAAIHEVLVEAFGGSPGIRDMAALRSTVFRPRSGHYEDTISKAAALWEGVVINHPFMDANLRTAVVAADIHLRLNGFLLDVNPSADNGFFNRVAQAGSKESERIEPWLRKHARKH